MLACIKLERDTTERISKVLEKPLELKLEAWIIHGIGHDSGQVAQLCLCVNLPSKNCCNMNTAWHPLVPAWGLVVPKTSRGPEHKMFQLIPADPEILTQGP